MKYKATYLKDGTVTELTAEKVHQIQTNGFGGLFKFEPINEGRTGVLPDKAAEIAGLSEEETEPETPPKSKKTPK